MITLFIITLAVLGTVFASLPVIGFALMLETCEDRASTGARGETAMIDDDEAPVSSLRLAHI